MAQMDPSLFPTRGSKRRSTSIYASPARWSPPPVVYAPGGAILPPIVGQQVAQLPALPADTEMKAEDDYEEVEGEDGEEGDDYAPRHLIDSEAAPLVSGKRVRRPKAPPTLIVNTPKQLKKRRTGSYVPSDLAEAPLVAESGAAPVLPPLPGSAAIPGESNSLPALPPLASEALPGLPSIPSTSSGTETLPTTQDTAQQESTRVEVEHGSQQQPDKPTSDVPTSGAADPSRSQGVEASQPDFSTVSATDEPMDALSAVAAAIAAADRSAKSNGNPQVTGQQSSTQSSKPIEASSEKAQEQGEASNSTSSTSTNQVEIARLPSLPQAVVEEQDPTSPASKAAKSTPAAAATVSSQSAAESQDEPSTQEETTDEGAAAARRSSRRSGPPKWYDAAASPSIISQGYQPMLSGNGAAASPMHSSASPAVNQGQPIASGSRTRPPRASTSSNYGDSIDLPQASPSTPAPYGGLPLLPSFARHLEAQRAGAAGGAGGGASAEGSSSGAYGHGMIDYGNLQQAQGGQVYHQPLGAHDSNGSLHDMSMNSPGAQMPDFLQPSKRKRRRYPRGWQNPSDAMICANCHTDKSPLWRRNAQGAYECNACCKLSRFDSYILVLSN